VQFPWRWLSITSMAGSLLLAASIPQWRERVGQLRPRDWAVALVFVLSLAFTGNEVVRDSNYLSRAQFQPLLQEIRGAVSFKDWLPTWANDFLQLEKMNSQVEAGARSITITSWEPQRRLFHVDAGPSGVAHVRTYFYPHWVATEGGRSLNTSAAADGTLLVTIPDRAADVEVAFREPQRVRIAAIVSALAALGIVGLAIFGWRRRFRTIEGVRVDGPSGSSSAKLFVSPI
jgi:hypothetical protein